MTNQKMCIAILFLLTLAVPTLGRSQVSTPAQLGAAPVGVVLAPSKSDNPNNADSTVNSPRYIVDALLLDAVAGRVEDKLQEKQDWYWGIAVTLGAVFIGLLTFIWTWTNIRYSQECERWRYTIIKK